MIIIICIFFGLIIGLVINITIYLFPISIGINKKSNLTFYTNKKRFFIVEILSTLNTLCITHFFNINIKSFAALLFTSSLLPLIFIDIEHKILPNDITIPLIWLGLFCNAFNLFTSPANAIIGAITGYTSLWLISYLFTLLRGIQGMGHGDFKLFAVFGAWLGLQSLPTIIMLASLTGSICSITLSLLKKHRITQPFPFGPYLIASGYIVLFLQIANN